MADPVALAREAEEIREALARKQDDPRARLAEIERRLEEHWEAEHARRMEAEAEYERLLAEYLPTRDAANEALSAFVSETTRAAELRRHLETARRRAGRGAPEKASVRASRDRPYRELRQNARLCAGADY
jgi:hypothetical protein